MPGPDILYVFTESLAKGSKWGIAIATGLVTGLIVHTTIVATGLGVTIQESKLLFALLKYGGAVYLTYLLYLAFLDKGPPSIVNNRGKSTYNLLKLVKRGFIMNVLNPKVSIFFLAFFPSFVHEDSTTPIQDYMVLGLAFMLQAMVVFYSVAFLAGKLNKVMQSKRFWQGVYYFRLIALALIIGTILVL